MDRTKPDPLEKLAGRPVRTFMTDRKRVADALPANPALIVGAILALGVIRLMEQATGLDMPPEESGTDGVSTTEGEARE